MMQKKGGLNMISAWNLLWIIPVSVLVGIMYMALVIAGRDNR